MNAVSAAAYRARFSEYDRQRILADKDRGEEFFRKHSAPFDVIVRSALDADIVVRARKEAIDV
jgi:hypothetical protein